MDHEGKANEMIPNCVLDFYVAGLYPLIDRPLSYSLNFGKELRLSMSKCFYIYVLRSKKISGSSLEK